jgi:hypothetical protein
MSGAGRGSGEVSYRGRRPDAQGRSPLRRERARLLDQSSAGALTWCGCGGLSPPAFDQALRMHDCAAAAARPSVMRDAPEPRGPLQRRLERHPFGAPGTRSTWRVQRFSAARVRASRRAALPRAAAPALRGSRARVVARHRVGRPVFWGGVGSRRRGWAGGRGEGFRGTRTWPPGARAYPIMPGCQARRKATAACVSAGGSPVWTVTKPGRRRRRPAAHNARVVPGDTAPAGVLIFCDS